MDSGALATKTEKGVEEIRSRAHGLPQKLRTLLIMVDGRSTVGQLLARFPGVAEIEANLRSLVEQGFVVLSGGAPTSAAAPAGAAPAAAESRAQALAGLVRFLIDAMGPDADLVTDGIERARGRAEFESAAARCVKMLEGLAGEAKAAAFRERARQFADRFLAG